MNRIIIPQTPTGLYCAPGTTRAFLALLCATLTATGLSRNLQLLLFLSDRSGIQTQACLMPRLGLFPVLSGLSEHSIRPTTSLLGPKARKDPALDLSTASTVQGGQAVRAWSGMEGGWCASLQEVQKKCASPQVTGSSRGRASKPTGRGFSITGV